jgi:hypothetical protein
MRSLSALALLSLLVLASSCAKKDDDASTTSEEGSTAAIGDTVYKRYGLKQAHIHYESSGWRRGTEDLYFTDWGRREARYTDAELLLDKGVQPEKTITVTIGSEMKRADLRAQGGVSRRDPFVDSLIKLREVDPPSVISDKVLTKLRYTQVGTGTHLGKPVTIWHEQTSGTTLHTWEGMVLKQEVKTPQHNQVVEAVSIDTVSPIPDSVFTPPPYDYPPAPEGRPRR